MKLKVYRYSTSPDSTLGVMYDMTDTPTFLCYTLEDTFHEEKIYGETRIPQGEYILKLHAMGSFHERYGKRFGAMHKGMIHVTDVPGFSYILIHCGNTKDDTHGCLLLGDGTMQNATEEGQVIQSTKAYRRVYKHIVDNLSDEPTTLEYINVA